MQGNPLQEQLAAAALKEAELRKEADAAFAEAAAAKVRCVQ